MDEKFFYIESGKARELLHAIENIKHTKRGIDRHAFLVDEYAILSTNRLKLRNLDTRDDSFIYLDQIIDTLMNLYKEGVAVVPILGYCYDRESEDGTGYMFQYRAKGQELFDDAIVSRFQVWAQDKPDGVYLSSDLSDDDAARYISRRTQEIAMAPQEHFDKFIYDMIVILNREILIDFNGQSNFFYDSNVGFQFIDLDAHNDYKYGLTKQKQNIEEIVALGGFTPCHYAVGTKVFASTALDEKAMCKVGGEKLRDIRKNNRIIFEKCRVAMKNNGIPEERINSSMKKLKIYD